MKHTIALLAAGVSAVAFLAGGANAQTLPGVVTGVFVNGDVYSAGAGAPKGADLTNIVVPGIGTLAPNGAGVLENLDGVLTPVGTGLNANGTPIVTVYSSEGAAYTAAAGTGTKIGKVLVSYATGALVPCNAGCGCSRTTGCCSTKHRIPTRRGAHSRSGCSSRVAG